VEIMGPGKYGNVGKTQPVLGRINLIMSIRIPTRAGGRDPSGLRVRGAWLRCGARVWGISEHQLLDALQRLNKLLAQRVAAGRRRERQQQQQQQQQQQRCGVAPALGSRPALR
jgi:hypothetical protein